MTTSKKRFIKTSIGKLAFLTHERNGSVLLDVHCNSCGMDYQVNQDVAIALFENNPIPGRRLCLSRGCDGKMRPTPMKGKL